LLHQSFGPDRPCPFRWLFPSEEKRAEKREERREDKREGKRE